MRYMIGAGNWSMGDDGIGLRLIEHIARNRLDQGFEAIDIADDGMRLIDYLAPETERILLVDAVDLGLPAGQWRVFAPEHAESHKTLTGITTHEGDILKVLEFARDLGYPIPKVRILGIQPERMAPGMELSETLMRHFEEYLKAALEEISRTD